MDIHDRGWTIGNEKAASECLGWMVRKRLAVAAPLHHGRWSNVIVIVPIRVAITRDV